MSSIQFQRAPGMTGRGATGAQGMHAFKPMVRAVTPARARFEAKIDMELGKRQELVPVTLPSLNGWGQETTVEKPAPLPPKAPPVRIYDAFSAATPSMRAAAKARSERLARLSTPPAPPPRVAFDPPPIDAYRAPPIPNHLIETAVDLLDVKLKHQPISRGPVEIILRMVLRFYPTMTITDLKSARRTADVVRARQIAMYLCRTMTTRSLPDIGRRMGGRDHTTVLHGFRKIGALVQVDPALAAHINEIKALLPEAVAQ